MNEQIRKLAQAAGLGFHGESITILDDELPEVVLSRFAELVAADVREECAKICDEGSSFDGDLIRARWWR
jgi:hypothetical protein